MLIPCRHCAIDLQGPDWSGVRSRITDRWFIWVNLSLDWRDEGGDTGGWKEDKVAEPPLHSINKDIGCSHLLMLASCAGLSLHSAQPDAS